MALNRREFLILGAGLGIGNLGLNRDADAGENAKFLEEFPNLIAQVTTNNIFPSRHSGFMTQSDYGNSGNNFEAVFPSVVKGLAQVYRDNAQNKLPWIGPLAPEYKFDCSMPGFEETSLHGSFFGAGEASEVSLIQSNFTDGGSSNGHLELSVRHGLDLALYWRESGGSLSWTGPLYIPSNESHSGNPALIQGDFGTKGNFELIAPHAETGMVHYTRFNDDLQNNLPWSKGRRFGQSLGKVDAVAIIQSDYIDPGESNGHLEAIARVEDRLFALWQESKEPYDWNLIQAPITDNLGTTIKVAGLPSLIQTRDRDFHLIVPLSDGSMAHLRRDNNLDSPSWKLESQFEATGGKVEAVSLLQNNSQQGNLELLAQVSSSEAKNRFEHFFAPDKLNWQAGGEFEETSGDFATQGEWLVPYSLKFETIGIHAAVLHTGNVLFIGYAQNQNQEIAETTISILDPRSGQQMPAPGLSGYNKFCSGHAFLPDGRLVVAAGNVVTKSTESLHTFEPASDGSNEGTWTDFSTMNGGTRWYPTCTTLPNGKVFILGGTDEVYTTIKQTLCQQDPGANGFRQVNKTYEIFDGTSEGKGAAIPLDRLFDNCQTSMGLYGLYPFVFVLPNNQLFIHANTYSYFIDISQLETNPENPPEQVKLKSQTNVKTSRTYPSQGTGVLLPLRPEEDYQARIMLIGGGVSCEFKDTSDLNNCLDNPNSGKPITADGSPVLDVTQCNLNVKPRDDWPATNECEILEIKSNQQITETNSEEHPQWISTQPMAQRRLMPDAVLLPDGTVFVSGGSSSGTADAARMPILDSEIYDPIADTWTTVAAMHVPRLYHAASVLLPSGEVMTSGTDNKYNIAPFDRAEYRVEVFKPPYLFKGQRPQILSSSSELLQYGASFTVETPDAAAIKSVCAIAPGATTHSFNMHQRYIELEWSVVSNTQLELIAPPNSKIAPPGYYMLFLLNDNGVPSEAKFIKLTA